MTEDRRAKRVARRIMEERGRFLIEEAQGPGHGLITVTRVEMTPDLVTARVFLSVFGGESSEEVFARLERMKGSIRRLLASRVNLKYNPELIFLPDPAPEYGDRLDRLIGDLPQEGGDDALVSGLRRNHLDHRAVLVEFEPLGQAGRGESIVDAFDADQRRGDDVVYQVGPDPAAVLLGRDRRGGRDLDEIGNVDVFLHRSGLLRGQHRLSCQPDKCAPVGSQARATIIAPGLVSNCPEIPSGGLGQRPSGGQTAPLAAGQGCTP